MRKGKDQGRDGEGRNREKLQNHQHTMSEVATRVPTGNSFRYKWGKQSEAAGWRNR